MNARRAGLVAVVVTIGALAAWLVRHHPPPSERRTTQAPPRAGIRLEEIEVRGRRGGEKDWDLSAESIEVPRRGGPTILKQVHEAVLYRGGEPYLRLKAGEIRLDEGTGAFSIRDGLAARMGERVRFSAPGADWDPKRRRLACRGPITLELGRTRITAPKMIYDAERQEFVCAAGVRVTAGRNVMRADRLVAGVEDEVLSMTGNGRGRFWVGEVKRLMSDDELDRALLERVRFILKRLRSRTG